MFYNSSSFTAVVVAEDVLAVTAWVLPLLFEKRFLIGSQGPLSFRRTAQSYRASKGRGDLEGGNSASLPWAAAITPLATFSQL